jgi:hypothetical protein
MFGDRAGQVGHRGGGVLVGHLGWLKGTVRVGAQEYFGVWYTWTVVFPHEFLEDHRTGERPGSCPGVVERRFVKFRELSGVGRRNG